MRIVTTCLLLMILCGGCASTKCSNDKCLLENMKVSNLTKWDNIYPVRTKYSGNPVLNKKYLQGWKYGVSRAVENHAHPFISDLFPGTTEEKAYADGYTDGLDLIFSISHMYFLKDLERLNDQDINLQDE